MNYAQKPFQTVVKVKLIQIFWRSPYVTVAGLLKKIAVCLSAEIRMIIGTNTQGSVCGDGCVCVGGGRHEQF